MTKQPLFWGRGRNGFPKFSKAEAQARNARIQAKVERNERLREWVASCRIAGEQGLGDTLDRLQKIAGKRQIKAELERLLKVCG